MGCRRETERRSGACRFCCWFMLLCSMPRRLKPRSPHEPGRSTKPFVKWAGGKSTLAPRIVTLLRSVRFRRYYEPFVGGGAVFFALLPRSASLSDANPELVNAYTAVRNHVEQVIEQLEGYKARHSKEEYYRARANPPADSAKRAAWFIYLNKTCFNGLWRVNSTGAFNVPIGSYVNPRIVDPAGLRACSEALSAASLRTSDFAESLEGGTDRPSRSDVVYLDPPYDPVSPTSRFTAYTRGGFGVPDQERLADLCRALDKSGVRFVLSDSDTPLVTRLFSGAGFRVEKVAMGRSINSVGTGRGRISESLIWNF
jgi:DNA adenine methylase